MVSHNATAEQLAALTATVNAWREEDKRDREEAQLHRKELAIKLSGLEREVMETGQKQAKLEREMAGALPVLEAVRNWKSMMTGAIMLLGVVGAVVGFAWTTFRDKIIAAFSGG